MEITYLEVIGGIIVMLMTGVGSFLVSLSSRVRTLEKDKMDKDEFHELKSDVKKILEEIFELKLEHATWLAHQEAAKKSK